MRAARQRRRIAPCALGRLTIIASDLGPGISDIARALRDGFSSCGGLGLGLPGVRRLMDEFDINSQPGAGTTVTVTKWHL